MKIMSFLLNAVLVFMSIVSQAQTVVQKGLPYQGYAVDNDGKAISNKTIVVKFSIAPGSYTEEIETNTNEIGMFYVVVGISSQAKNKEFSAINFFKKSTIYTLKVEAKLKSGGNYQTITEEPLRTVPYANTAGNGVPVGSVVAFGGNTVPLGWLLCDGKSVLKTDYPNLFNLIGYAYGGSGASFNLPDYRGVFLSGMDASESDTLDTSKHTYTTAAPRNRFTVTESQHNHSYIKYQVDYNGDLNTIQALTGKYNSDGSFPTGATNTFGPDGAHTHNSVTGGDNETRPYNAAVLYMIKH